MRLHLGLLIVSSLVYLVLTNNGMANGEGETETSGVVVPCATCKRVANSIALELQKIETVRDVNSIPNEEELAKHHARGCRRKMMHGRSEIKIREALQRTCACGATVENKELEKGEVSRRVDGCETCKDLLHLNSENEYSETFLTILDHTYEHGPPNRNELAEFLCQQNCGEDESFELEKDAEEGAREEL